MRKFKTVDKTAIVQPQKIDNFSASDADIARKPLSIVLVAPADLARIAQPNSLSLQTHEANNLTRNTFRFQ